MKITSFRTVLPAFLLLGSNNIFHASAAVIAYWNFNNLSVATAGAPGTGDVPSTITADQGSGTLELFGAWNGLVDDFDGSTINALNGDPAGASLSLVSDAGNGSGILITRLSFPDSNPVVVSFAVRGNSSGFDDGTWDYSTDGNFFIPFPSSNTATRSTTYEQVSFEIPVAGFANAIIRYRLEGATSSFGENRIDNPKYRDRNHEIHETHEN